MEWALHCSDERPGVSHGALYSMDDLDLPGQEQQLQQDEELMEDDCTSMDFVWLYFLRGIIYLIFLIQLVTCMPTNMLDILLSIDLVGKMTC